MRRGLLAAAWWLTCCVAAGCGTSAEEHFARGDAYARSGQYAEAAVEFHRAVQEDDQHGEAYYRLGQASERISDFAAAARHYIRAGELLPGRAEVQTQSAAMLLLDGRFEEALACAERALHMEPRNVRAQILHGHALSGARRAGEALTSLQQAVLLDPTRGATYADFGVFQLSTGSLEQGEQNLRRAAESTPPSLPAHIMLASYYWAQSRLDEAERYLTRAVEIAPLNVQASRALAAFYLASNRSAEAEALLRRVAGQSGNAALRLALADYYIVMGRQPEAVRILEVVAASRGGYADARSRLAALLYAAGERASAHRLIDETLRTEPRSSRALLTKANFLLTDRRFDEGSAMLESAVAADPRSVPARFALATLLAARHDVKRAVQEFAAVLELDRGSLSARMELARLHLVMGNADAAAPLAEQVVEARPSLDASLLLAQIYVGRREISRAETILRPLVDTTARADVLSLAGATLIGVGESERGRALIERAIRLNPGQIEPIESLVAADLAAGNVARARTFAEQQIARLPGNSRLQVLVARTYGAGGDVDRMTAALHDAIRSDPANTVAYALLGQLYASRGRLDAALAEFERLVERDRRSVSGHTMAAILLERLGRDRDAERRYERVLQLDSRAAVAANNLAWLITKRGGNLDVALQHATVAKEVLPEAPDVNDTLAWVYYRKDLPELAVPLLQQAIERDPSNPLFHYHLGQVFRKVGEINSAIDALETALKLNPRFDGAADARESLAALQ